MIVRRHGPGRIPFVAPYTGTRKICLFKPATQADRIPTTLSGPIPAVSQRLEGRLSLRQWDWEFSIRSSAVAWSIFFEAIYLVPTKLTPNLHSGAIGQPLSEDG